MLTSVHITSGLHEGKGFENQPTSDSIFTVVVICNESKMDNPFHLKYNDKTQSFRNNVVIFGEFHLLHSFVKD